MLKRELNSRLNLNDPRISSLPLYGFVACKGITLSLPLLEHFSIAVKCTILFIYGLVKYIISRADYVTPNGMQLMNEKEERI